MQPPYNPNQNPGQPPYQGQPPQGPYPGQPYQQPGQPPYQGQYQQPPGQYPYQAPPPTRSRRGCLIVALVLVVLIVAAGVVAAATGSLSFSFSIGDTAITSVEMGKGYKDGKALNPTTTFAPTDQEIFCVIQLSNPKDTNTLKAIWYGTDDPNGTANIQLLEKSISTTKAEDTVFFSITRDRPWPKTNYKVEIYLNDKLAKTVEFKVA